MSEPKILLWDIETVQNIVATFRLMNMDPIPHQNIFQERYIVSASWKWLGDPKVHSVSVLDFPGYYKQSPHNDLYVCEALHKVLSEADVSVAHNGDQYDIKFTETRMLKHNLSPLGPSRTIDTLKAAKARFLFNSNRLDYLARFLFGDQKIHTDGDLWLDILKGGPAAEKAIKEMVHYNKKDVLLLEKVFLRLRPYMSDYINHHLFEHSKGTCPRCGSHKIQSRGIRRTVTQAYTQYQCQACGGWFRDRKALPAIKSPVRPI